MRLVRYAAAAVLLALMAACNGGDGGDSLTIEQYFAELERIGNDAQARIDEIDLPELDADASFEESRDALADFFAASTEVSGDAIGEVQNLEPPAEVEDEHDRYVESLGEIPEISSDLEQRIRDAETEEEYEEVVGNENPLGAVGDEVTAACDALQQIADDNEIEVDLGCAE